MNYFTGRNDGAVVFEEVEQPAAEPQGHIAIGETHGSRNTVITKAVKRQQQCVALDDVCCGRFAVFLACGSANHRLRPVATCLCAAAASDGIMYNQQDGAPMLRPKTTVQNCTSDSCSATVNTRQ